MKLHMTLQLILSVKCIFMDFISNENDGVPAFIQQIDIADSVYWLSSDCPMRVLQLFNLLQINL